MANTNTIVDTFKTDLMNGLHAFGASVIRAATTKDNFRGALYVTTGSLGAGTTAYTPTNELTGTNYTATGELVGNTSPPSVTSNVAHWTPSASLSWTTLTSNADFDALLLYNDTATGKNAVAVFNFGNQTVTAGNFTLTMPADSDTTGLLRLN